jgi:MFS family permease
MRGMLPAAGPQRVFSAATFVYSIGSGVYLTASVLYFTQAIRLSASEVGAGLSIAGLLSLGAGIGAGYLADHHSPRAVYFATLAVRATATAGFVLADSFPSFLLMVCIATAAHAAGLGARSPIIRRHGGSRPQEFRAYLRALTNVGISIGALLAGLAVAADTRAAYDLLVLGNAASFVAAAALLFLLPRQEPYRSPPGPRWIALRDRPYLTLTALDGVMSIQFRVLTVAVPLWLVEATTAPHWLVSVTMFVSTMLVIALQVPTSRSVTSPSAGGRAYRRAGLIFLMSCSVISLAANGSPWAAAGVLMAGVVIHTIGELWHSAGNFELSFALAPKHATGQYLGAYAMGDGVAEALGPSLLVALCITLGQPGWFIIGALFALTGFVVPAVTRWAIRGFERTAPPSAGVSQPVAPR